MADGNNATADSLTAPSTAAKRRHTADPTGLMASGAPDAQTLFEPAADSSSHLMDPVVQASSTAPVAATEPTPPLDSTFLLTETGGIQNAHFAESVSDEQKLLSTHFPHIRTELVRGVFTCTLEKDVLWHGRLIYTRSHLCFYGRLFSKVAKVCTPWRDVLSLEKRNTAGLFPNAIRVATLHSKYVFSSFIKRDHAYTRLRKEWRHLEDSKDPTASPGTGTTPRAHTKKSEFQVTERKAPSTSDLSTASFGSQQQQTQQQQFQQSDGGAGNISNEDDDYLVNDNGEELGSRPDTPAMQQPASVDLSQVTDIGPSCSPDSNENLSLGMVVKGAAKGGALGGMSLDEDWSDSLSNGPVIILDENNSVVDFDDSGQAVPLRLTQPAPSRKSFTLPLRVKESTTRQMSAPVIHVSDNTSATELADARPKTVDTVQTLSPDPVAAAVPLPSAPVSCECAQHHKHKVCDRVLVGLTPQQLFNIQFGRSGAKFLTEFHRKRGSPGYAFVPWSGGDENSLVGATREVVFDAQFKAPLMPVSTTKCIERQCILRDDPFAKVVESVTKTPGVPYGESFEVINKVCITFEAADKTRLFVSTKILFVKRVMWERAIESGAVDGTTTFSKELCAQIMAHLQAHGTAFGDDNAVEAPSDDGPVNDSPAPTNSPNLADTNASPPVAVGQLDDNKVQSPTVDLPAQHKPAFMSPLATVAVLSFVALLLAFWLTAIKRQQVHDHVDRLAAQLGYDHQTVLSLFQDRLTDGNQASLSDMLSTLNRLGRLQAEMR